MRYVVDGIGKVPRPEEAVKRPSRRTHGAHPADRQFLHTLESGNDEEAANIRNFVGSPVRFEPQGAAVVDRHLLAGCDRAGGDQVEGMLGIVAIDPGAWPGRMIAQGDKAKA